MSDRQYPEPQEEPKRRRGDGAWIGALVLIAIGAIFFLRNFGLELPQNWWALFILIPAVGSLGNAGRLYAREGLSGAALGSLITGIGFVALTGIFIFGIDINWDLIWPVIPIVIGLGVLARSYGRSSRG